MLDIDVQTLSARTVRLATDRSYWNFTSAFGGWVAGVIIELTRRDPRFRGEVITQQMQFIEPVEADDLDISVQQLARRTSVDFWRVEVHDPDGRPLVTADLTSGLRRPTELGFEEHRPAGSPDGGAPMVLTPFHPTWTAQFEQVMIEGEPFTVADRPRSVVRTRPVDDVAFDPAVLAMICDSPMPRTFFAGSEPVFGSTLSLANHIYASDEQIAAVGRGFVTVEADSAVIRNTTLNQEVRVFRADGLLLACSYQTASFR